MEPVSSVIHGIYSGIRITGSTLLSYAKRLVFTSEDPVAAAEDRFLRCLNNQYYRYYVEISENCRIWTLSNVPPPSDEDTDADAVSGENKLPAIVMIHGLISGLAYWAMNLDTMVSAGHDVYALDLPGFSRSSRIVFSDDCEESERIFIDVINAWREKLGIKEMILIGHSFGGYLATIYGIKYPDSTTRLILVDPWGFPDVREEVTAMIESGDSSNLTSPITTLPIWIRIMVMVFMPFSPFTFLRLAGQYLGPRLIHVLRPDMTQRYARIFGDDDYHTVPRYIYHTNNFAPTGEYAFRSMAMPLAWAKRPLIKRIGELNESIELTFIYGSRSWIDFQTGFEVRKILERSIVNVYIIEGAGHHLFADEPEKFNSLIFRILTKSESDEITEQTVLPEETTLCIKDLSMK